MFHCTRTHAHAQARTGARSQAHARTGPLCPARSGSATTSTFPHHIAATDQPGRRPSRATFPDLVHAPRTYTHTNRYRLTHGVPLLAPSPVQFRIRGHPRCPHCGSASPVMTTMTSLTAVRSPHADCDKTTSHPTKGRPQKRPPRPAPRRARCHPSHVHVVLSRHPRHSKAAS